MAQDSDSSCAKCGREVPPRPAIQATVRFSAWPRRSTSTTEEVFTPHTYTPRITQPGTKYRCHLAMWPWPSHLPSLNLSCHHNKMRERDVTHTVMEPFCWVPILCETQKHHLTLNPRPPRNSGSCSLRIPCPWEVPWTSAGKTLGHECKNQLRAGDATRDEC